MNNKDLNKIVLEAINSISYRCDFDYNCERKSFTYYNGAGFILKNEEHYFKYPFVKTVFSDSFETKEVMNVLIKKSTDLSKLASFHYEIIDNKIKLFNLFEINIFKESILINYLNFSILIKLEDFKLLSYQEKNLIFKFKNETVEKIKHTYQKMYDLKLYVYSEEKESYLQDVKIYLDHEVFFMKFMKVINNIIAFKLEEIEKLESNSIKIISL